jgi:peptide/nickel transport system ATP-binding protein
MLLRLEEPSAGTVHFDGEDITQRRGRALLPFRARAQLVFQNPFDALNPRFTIRRTLAEPLRNFGVPEAEHAARIEAAMGRVRLTPASAWLDRFAHELSGGQLQRVVLARALIPGPKLIVADEPVSMLDVSVRAGILNLLRAARDELGLAAIYISHDLALIRYVCERTMVMYLGRVRHADRRHRMRVSRPVPVGLRSLHRRNPHPAPRRRRPPRGVSFGGVSGCSEEGRPGLCRRDAKSRRGGPAGAGGPRPLLFFAFGGVGPSVRSEPP